MILVTGASGLFGRALARRLIAEGRTLATVGRSAPATIEADLRIRAHAVKTLNATGPNVVVHLAGGRGTDRFDLYERNVLTTVQVLEAAATLAKAPFVIVMGSAAEYGIGEEVPISEEASLRPVSDYGQAKVAQTTLAQSMGKRYGIPILVLRPFNPVSPDLARGSALGSARSQLLAGRGTTRRLTLGRLDVVRDFVSVDTIIEAVVRAIDRGPMSGVINVCSGIGIKLQQVVHAMATQLDVGLSIETDPYLATLPAADVVVGDPSKLRSVLGIEEMVTPASIAARLLS